MLPSTKSHSKKKIIIIAVLAAVAGVVLYLKRTGKLAHFLKGK